MVGILHEHGAEHGTAQFGDFIIISSSSSSSSSSTMCLDCWIRMCQDMRCYSNSNIDDHNNSNRNTPTTTTNNDNSNKKLTHRRRLLRGQRRAADALHAHHGGHLLYCTILYHTMLHDNVIYCTMI